MARKGEGHLTAGEGKVGKIRRYEPVEHTAETGIRAFGSGLDEIFANAAYGMFDLMTDLSKVKPKGEFEVRLEAGDLQAIMVDWLTNLLFIHETHGVYLSEFQVHIEGKSLSAKVMGEKIDRRRHRPRLAVKAVTYHMMDIDPKAGQATVLLDV